MKPLSLKRLIINMRDDFKSGNQDIILLFAHNGVGKTRLSMAFKDYIDKKSKSNKTNAQTLDYKHTIYLHING